MRIQSAASAAHVASTSVPIDVRLMRSGANVLLALVLLAGLAVLGSRLARSPWFNLREIHVEGEVAHNTAESVRQHVTPLLTGSYLTMDLAHARTAFESVPWVRRAEVRRIWPHDLVVRIEEHRPVAYWAREDTDHLLVNTHGELFEVNLGDVEDDNLPDTRRVRAAPSLQVMTMVAGRLAAGARAAEPARRARGADRSRILARGAGPWHGARTRPGRVRPDRRSHPTVCSIGRTDHRPLRSSGDRVCRPAAQ